MSSNEIVNGWTPYLVAMYHHGPSLATGMLEFDETVPSKSIPEQAPTAKVFE